MSTALLLTFALAFGCQGMDLGTTAAALATHQFQEGNRLMHGPQLYGLKVGVNIGAVIWQHRIQQEHPTGKRRFVVPIALASAGCGASAWNLHQMRRAR